MNRVEKGEEPEWMKEVHENPVPITDFPVLTANLGNLAHYGYLISAGDSYDQADTFLKLT